MKHTYSPLTSWLRWLCLCLLLALPGLGFAQTVSLTPDAGGDPQNFGSVPVNTFSASKSYKVTGSSLTRDVTVSVPAGFEGSTDNNNFNGTNITLAMGNGSVSATIYLRFSPTATKAYSDDFFASSRGATASYITVNGTGITGDPTITISPDALGFRNQIKNTTSSPMSVKVTGTSLTADITVTAPTDFLVSSDGTTYGTTATLTQTNGSVNATLRVEFNPQTAQSYVSTVTLVSGMVNQSISVSGTGIAPTPVLNVSPTTLPDFGSVVVGNSSTTTGSFTIDGQNLSSNVTITPPIGFRIRMGTGVFSTNAIVLIPTNSSIASTTIDVRFTPTAAQAYSSNIVVSTPNASSSVTQSVAVSGTGTPAPTTPTVIINPGALDFGTVTNSGSANILMFDVSGTNLTNDIVLTPSKNTIQFRNASAKGVFSSNPITLTQTNGTVATQTIEVRLVASVPQGTYNEQINAVSGSVSSPVSISANNSSGAISEILAVTNGDNTFVTQPGSISPSQTFLVSANNLLQDLTVAPSGANAGYFQVSKDDIVYSSSITYTPVNGKIDQQTVYVRFVPGDAKLTIGAVISNTSSPAPDNDVSVTGISQPTIRLVPPAPATSIGDFGNIVKGTTSMSRNVRIDGFLLSGTVGVQFPDDDGDLKRNPAKTPQFEFSLDGGTTFAKMGTIVPDKNGSFSKTVSVRYSPVRVGSAIQSLQYSNSSISGTTDYIPFNNNTGLATGYAYAIEPTAQATASVVRSGDGNSSTISFNLTNPPAGKAYGLNRLVIASSTYTTLPASLFPTDQTSSYNPGNTDANNAYVFGKGTATEASTNTYVVFKGASNSFTVSNLDPNTQYYFYSFEYNNDELAGAENYLVPNNQPLMPLPVELVSFTAQLRNKQVNLNWVTASEKNSRSFEVQRSSNGQTFTTVLTKDAQGNTSARTTYDAVDRQPLPGLSYYRLKQIDNDGTVAYSPVVSVQSDGLVDISIYPNPTAGKVTITLPAALAASAPRVRISDMMGRVVQEVSLPASGEVDLGALPVGTYLINVGGQQVRSRVVKY